MIAIVVSMLGIVLTYLLAPVIFRYTIHSRETYNMCIEFLRIRIWGFFYTCTRCVMHYW